MSALDYQEYTAKSPLPTAEPQAKPGLKRMVRKLICDWLMLPVALPLHRELLRSGKRVDNHTYTCFLRAPSQLKLLCGPVLDYIGQSGQVKITLLACSNGAEAYTIASWLMQNVPTLDFHIRASDLHPEMVARARSATYSSSEVLHSDYMTDSFLHATFLPQGDGYVVRPEVRERVSFSQASLLDGEGLRAQFGEADLVIAQNVLFHLAPEDSAKAFANIVSLTAPGGAMLVEGMDLDLREKLVREHGLEPFTENLREVHEETRIHTPARWWRFYWGTEPFMGFRSNKEQRYATAWRRNAI